MLGEIKKMKNKIRTIASAFVITTVFALTGCGSSKDAYTLYTQANTKNENASSISMVKDTVITIKAKEQEVSSSNKVDLKKVVNSESDIDLMLSLTSGMNGEEYNKVDGYYNDGYMYFTANNQKYKEKLDYEQVVSEMDLSGYEVKKDIISESTVTDGSNGEKTLNFKFNTESMASSLDKNIEALKTAIGAADENLNISEASLDAVTDKNGELKSYEFKMSAVLGTEQQTVPFDYSTKTTYSDLNSTKVEFPQDLESYTDISELSDSGLENTNENTNENTEGQTEN